MKSKFMNQLVVELLDEKRNRWRLIYPLRYQSALMTCEIIVPAGFITDFASVPRLPLLYSLYGDSARAAAVVHDYLYRNPEIERTDADEVFLEAMKVSNVSWWRRYPMHWGVELFGWMFKKGRKS